MQPKLNDKYFKHDMEKINYQEIYWRPELQLPYEILLKPDPDTIQRKECNHKWTKQRTITT